MKKLLLTVLIAIGWAGALVAAGTDQGEKGHCRKLGEGQVKAYVEAALASAYGKPVEEHWQVRTITGHFRQAAHAQQRARRSLFFSTDNARLLARIELVEPGELSAKLTRKLTKKYKGYRIGQVIRYFDGETLYFVSLKKDQEEVLVSFAR